MLERNYKIDNIRFLAMFLVVFAHMIELFADCEQNLIYRIIYSFHMPLFIFISGYVARFDRDKILKKFIPTYLIFQTIYKIFDCLYVQDIDKITITYSNPYWFLWYLFILIGYYLLIPVFDESVYAAINVNECAQARKVIGGPAKEATEKAIAANKLYFEKL